MATEQTIAVAVATGGLAAALAALGVDPGVAFAAAIGAVGLLAFDTTMGARQALPAIVLGFGVGLYGAVPLTEYLGRPAGWKYIAALVLGACGYWILGGLVKLSQRFKRDPSTTLKEIK